MHLKFFYTKSLKFVKLFDLNKTLSFKIKKNNEILILRKPKKSYQTKPYY